LKKRELERREDFYMDLYLPHLSDEQKILLKMILMSFLEDSVLKLPK
jgi:hypothetical protein